MKIDQKNLSIQLDSKESYCKTIIKELNILIKDISSRSKSVKAASSSNQALPREFINAVEVLSTRVKSQKFTTSPVCGSRPVTSDHTILGPGSYNIERSGTPACS